MTNPAKKPSSRERVVRAAITLFTANGYYKTSTREIARLADVSEPTIFRHFSSKEVLFLSVLRSSFVPIQAHGKKFQGYREQEHPQTLLRGMLKGLVDVASYYSDAIRLSAIALIEVRGLAGRECLALLSPLLDAVESYLAATMEDGAFQKLNTSMTATAMTLTSLAYPTLARCIHPATAQASSARELCDEYLEFWMKVLASRPL